LSWLVMASWSYLVVCEAASLATIGGHARRMLTRLGPSTAIEQELRHDGELLVGELTTNAVRHARGPCTVSLAISARRLLIAVTDTSRRPAVVRPLDTALTYGRGLQLVDTLAHEWGTRLILGQGKSVWATLDRPRSVRPGYLSDADTRA
jgi:two-component sensor histidine kinase